MYDLDILTVDGKCTCICSVSFGNKVTSAAFFPTLLQHVISCCVNN